MYLCRFYFKHKTSIYSRFFKNQHGVKSVIKKICRNEKVPSLLTLRRDAETAETVRSQRALCLLLKIAAPELWSESVSFLSLTGRRKWSPSSEITDWLIQWMIDRLVGLSQCQKPEFPFVWFLCLSLLSTCIPTLRLFAWLPRRVISYKFKTLCLSRLAWCTVINYECIFTEE